MDLDFTDDIALLSEEIWQAQELLKKVQAESLSIVIKGQCQEDYVPSVQQTRACPDCDSRWNHTRGCK